MLYLDNPFRIFGVYANQNREAIDAAAARLAPWDGAGCTLGRGDPLVRLARLDRTREAIASAHADLDSAARRMRARLTWFTVETAADREAIDCLERGDLKGASAAWGADDDAALANRARMLHAVAIVRAIGDAPQSDADIDAADVREAGESDGPESQPANVQKLWRAAVQLWARVFAADAFWQRLAAQDAESGFAVASAEVVASLRGEAWQTVLEPSGPYLASLVATGDYGLARDHMDDLLEAGVPRRQVDALGMVAFEPLFSSIAAMLSAVRAELNAAVPKPTETMLNRAYASYQRRVLPKVRGLLHLCGPDFAPARAVLERCAAFLERLVEDAINVPNAELARSLQKEANIVLQGHVGVAHQVYDSSRPLAGRSGSGRRRMPTGAIVGLSAMALLIVIAIVMASRSDRTSLFGGNRETSDYNHVIVTEYNNEPPPPPGDDVEQIEEDSVGPGLTLRTNRLMSEADFLIDTMRQDARHMLLLADTIDRHIDKYRTLKSNVSQAAAGDSVNRAALDRARATWQRLCEETWERFRNIHAGYTGNCDRYGVVRDSLEALGHGSFPPFEAHPDVERRYRQLNRAIARAGIE